MANGLTVRLSSLTYGALDIQRSDLGIHLDVVDGLNNGLDVRGADTVIPSVAGRIPRSRVADVRSIVVAGWVQGVGSTEGDRLASYQNFLDALEVAFNPLDDPKTLVGMAADGTWRSIQARTLPGWVINPSPAWGVDQVSFALVSVEPNWEITGGGS